MYDKQNVYELSKNHKILEFNGYKYPIFRSSAVTAWDTSIMVNSILWVTNPIKEGQKGICLEAFDMWFGQPY